MVARVVPEHSKSAVGRASKLVGKGNGTPYELELARAVLSNFRSAHAYPLNAVTVTVRQKALLVNQNAIVAQRLKRLPTILDKLIRIPLPRLASRSWSRGTTTIWTPYWLTSPASANSRRRTPTTTPTRLCSPIS